MNPSVNLETTLHNLFGFDQFQTGQKEIITDLLKGNDVLGILPTGSGKSLCYQLPAKILPGITIVVSPLISLMVDQVRQVKSYYYKEVVALHSFNQRKERNHILTHLGNYKLIFISPELLQQKAVLDHLQRQHISLFVIDEAHCISQWGYDFRPDYLRLTSTIKYVGDPPVLALTGTATREIQIDIIKKLNRGKMKKHLYSMERTNIALAVEEITGGWKKKQEVLIEKINQVKAPTIIYFSSRKMTEQMTLFITGRVQERKVAFYHGGMQAMDRLKVQQQFMNDQLDIICCTSAFGMGINKSNIRFIIHYHLPTELESFVQEIGRAGRDGKQSVSLVLYREGDLHFPAAMLENELPTKDEIRFAFQQLKQMHVDKRPLPIQTEQLERTFHMDGTKWRFLHYQLEVRGILHKNQIYDQFDTWQKAFIDIQHFCTNRLEMKRKKLLEMFDWMHEKGCLRSALYRTFQEEVTQKESFCCSRCGFSIRDIGLEDDTNKHLEMEKPWEEKLRALFLIGEG